MIGDFLGPSENRQHLNEVGETASKVNSGPKCAAQKRFRVYLTALLLDLATLLACIMFLLPGLPLASDIQSPISLFVSVVAIYLVIAIHGDAYSSKILRGEYAGITTSLTALTLSFAALACVHFAIGPDAGLAPMALISAYGACFIGLAAVRSVHYLVAIKPAKAKLFDNVLLLDGMNKRVPKGWRTLDCSREGLRPDSDDPAMLDGLASRLEGADRVIVACSRDRLEAWAHLLKGCNLRGEIYLPELDRLAGKGLGPIDRQATVTVAVGPLTLRNRLLKRLFDIVLASVMLAILSPLMLGVALAIKWHDGGSIFFRQIRMGRGNRLFEVLKFRSMREERCDHSGDVSSSRDDVRVTPVGRIIRSTSIDELPQLLNVLRGEMSIVGPRPHALGSKVGERTFWQLESRYWHRHAAKPGITGLAQVCGLRGTANVPKDLTDRVEADLEYIRDWSIWTDIGILARTAGVVVHKNAY